MYLSEVHLDGDPLVLHSLLQCRALPPGVSAVNNVGDGVTSAGVTAEAVTHLTLLPRHVDDAGELAVRLEQRCREGVKDEAGSDGGRVARHFRIFHSALVSKLSRSAVNRPQLSFTK